MTTLKFCLPRLLAFTLLCSAPAAFTANPGPSNDLVRQLNETFVDVAEKVAPTVVVINVVQKVNLPAPNEDEDGGSFDSLPPGFWRRFHDQFKDGLPETTHGQGSGIIVRENGYILTNRHVVEDAESIEVRLKDGRTFKAVVRGVDPQSDVAVIKIEAAGLATAKLGDSARARVGEFVVAIGAPFSLDYSVTFGHVSAKGRSNVIEGSEGAAMDQDYIQTDALINPGNSGGPLVNLDGEVIGINTLIRGLHTGIGFAIPISLAKEVSSQLIEQGKFTRAWLGIAIQALRDNTDLKALIKGVDDGVVVSGILPEGPAAKSDLKLTDVITAVDGVRVSTPQDLRTNVRSKKIGEPITLDVFRKDKAIQVKVSPTEWTQPVTTVARVKNTPSAEPAPAGLGINVQALTRDLAKQFGLEPTEGVLVASVDKNSPAARKGLKAGDVITSIDQQRVASPREFREAIKKVDLKKGVLVNVLSQKVARFEILKAGDR
jgi:serine protease Do